ncbi:MAG TPA: type II toxin-antitoxin system RelE/ParE family toxin [Gaiellaceae bacterium]|nr:type II toxin-antitoxin system RelE/ParE family toxin [Gaiellaceae bacterium]
MEEPRWSLSFERRAQRDLGRLDPQIARRVASALDRLLDQDPSLDLRHLRGSDEWRLRVGDWRVRLQLEFETRTVVVVRVLPRGRAYDR